MRCQRRNLGRQLDCLTKSSIIAKSPTGNTQGRKWKILWYTIPVDKVEIGHYQPITAYRALPIMITTETSSARCYLKISSAVLFYKVSIFYWISIECQNNTDYRQI
jgi:hypothetical protein